MSKIHTRASIALVTVALSASALGQAPAAPAPVGDGAPPATTTDAAPTPGGADASRPQVAQQVDQFLHYIMIARPDLARTAGEALMADSVTPSQLAQVVDGMNLGDRLTRALNRGRSMGDGVGDLVGRFDVKLETGRRELARETARMKEAVAWLGGTIRQQGLGRARLEAAGEYAVPLLLGQIVESRDAKAELTSSEVLVEIRRLSVLPLVAALPDIDPTAQRKVSEILAQIGWPTAVPFLQELAERSPAPNDVREVAYRSIARLGGARGELSESFTNLARDFFLRKLPLIPYPNEATNNIWRWDDYGGLTPTPVPTEIFCDVMAMRLAERALRADPTNMNALAVFVAANLRRQNDLPEGRTDPVYGDLRASPQFFATIVGPTVGQQVLALALDTGDTTLVRDAIAALGETGGAGIVSGIPGRTPIIECLSYPDRRVRYDAAILLGRALPTGHFPQDTAVVPLLASAVRSAGVMYAAVVAPDQEDQRQIASSLTEKGFTVLGSAPTWNDLVASALVGGMVDLVAARGRSDQLEATLSGVRGTSTSSATPVLMVVASEDRPAVEGKFSLDRRVGFWTAGAPAETFANTVDDLLKRTVGGAMDEGEAVAYAMRSLETLGEIGISGSQVYRIEDAEKPLSEAIASRSGAVRESVARVMALIPTPSAQIRLIDVALGAADDEQIALLGAVAASGRRNGNHAEPRQVAALKTLVRKSSGPLADAAAVAYGALGLPVEDAVELLTK